MDVDKEMRVELVTIHCRWKYFLLAHTIHIVT